MGTSASAQIASDRQAAQAAAKSAKMAWGLLPARMLFLARGLEPLRFRYSVLDLDCLLVETFQVPRGIAKLRRTVNVYLDVIAYLPRGAPATCEDIILSEWFNILPNSRPTMLRSKLDGEAEGDMESVLTIKVLDRAFINAVETFHVLHFTKYTPIGGGGEVALLVKMRNRDLGEWRGSFSAYALFNPLQSTPGREIDITAPAGACVSSCVPVH